MRRHYANYAWDATKLRATSPYYTELPPPTSYRPRAFAGTEDRGLKIGLGLLVAAGVLLIVMGARGPRENPRPLSDKEKARRYRERQRRLERKESRERKKRRDQKRLAMMRRRKLAFN